MWDFILKYAEAITAITSMIGLISLLLIYKQLRDSRIWNKLHFTYTFFPNPCEFEEIEIFLDERISFWKRDSPISELEVKALLGRETLTKEEQDTLAQGFGPSVDKTKTEWELLEAGRKLKLYMNQIESYCAAISCGIIDSESAKCLYHYKFKRAYERALPWIEKFRSVRNEASIYIETAKVLNEWYPVPKGQEKKY